MALIGTLLLALLATAAPGSTPPANALPTCTAANELALFNCLSQYSGYPAGATLSVALVADIELTADLPTLSNAESPTAKLEIDGNGFALSRNAAFNPAEALLQTRGHVTTKRLEITGFSTGLRVVGGTVNVLRSTLTDNGRGIHIDGGDSHVIADSTLFANDAAFLIDTPGTVNVQRSTIADSQQIGVFAMSAVDFEGVLLAGNATACWGTITDGLGNVADQTCGSIAPANDPTGIVYSSVLDDNGCSSCAPTLALDATSVAVIDAHDMCSSNSADPLTDQRGEVRPDGMCDAGAFEFVGSTGCSGQYNVANEAGLGDVLDCYNQALSGQVVTLNLASDFTLTETAIINNQASPPATLNFDGGGHAIDGAGSITLLVDVVNGDVLISDLTIKDATFGLIHRGGDIAISRTTVTNNLIGLGSNQPGTFSGQMVVSDSTVAGNTMFGIYANSSQPVVIERTTIVDNGVSGLEIANVASGTVSVTVSGTLIAGNGAACRDLRASPARVVDGFGNAVDDTSCGPIPAATAPITYAPALANNDCVTPCTQTIALLADSAGAINVNSSNSCLSTIADQRGQFRPVQSACDAGAYEFSPYQTASTICDVIDVYPSGPPSGGSSTWATQCDPDVLNCVSPATLTGDAACVITALGLTGCTVGNEGPCVTDYWKAIFPCVTQHLLPCPIIVFS